MSASKNTQGGVIWITGVPAAGKSTLAAALCESLKARGRAVLWLDSDDLRKVMTPNPTYSPQERDFFYNALGHLATRGAEGGAIAIVSATAPRRRYRDVVRESVDPFVEIWLTCPYDTLQERDEKGLYEKYEAKEISNLPGRDVEYEQPRDAHLIFPSDDMTPDEMLAQTMDYLAARRMI